MMQTEQLSMTQTETVPMTPIPGYPNYSITEDGRVWSVPRLDAEDHRQGGRWLNPSRTPDGRLIVGLHRDGDSSGHTFGVHRLVLETFVGPCPPGEETCHINGDVSDNRLENLEWGVKQKREPVPGTMPIPGHPDYAITTDGCVWSYARKQWKKPFVTKGDSPGTTRVYLECPGRDRPASYRVAHLVLETFIGPRPPGVKARYRNGDRNDNRVENLYWGTSKVTHKETVAEETAYPVLTEHRETLGMSWLTFEDFIQDGAKHLEIDPATVRRYILMVLTENRLSVQHIEIYINHVYFSTEELAQHFKIDAYAVRFAQRRLRKLWPALANDATEGHWGIPGFRDMKHIDCPYPDSGKTNQDLVDDSRVMKF